MSASVKQNTGPRGWSSCVPKDRMKTSEEPFQPAAVIFTAIHVCSKHTASLDLHEPANINSSPFFSEPRLFQVSIVLFFFAEASNWKDCNCKMSPRLSDCNFNSLTSSRWEYLEQYIIASDGSWEYLNGLWKKTNKKKTLYESVRSDSVPLGIFWPSATL